LRRERLEVPDHYGATSGTAGDKDMVVVAARMAACVTEG
jgi:hypothetical protein